MATETEFADYVRDQMSGAGDVTSRKMFGEYAVYLDGRVVALLCDNQCFVKATDAGRAYLGSVTEAPPFPGANPHFLLADELDDRERVAALVRITADALPPAKKKAAPKPAKKTVGKPAKKAPGKKAGKKRE